MGERSRALSVRPRASDHDSWTNAGLLAARSWLAARRIHPPGIRRWHADVSLDIADRPAVATFDVNTDTRFRIEIYSEEWGFFFCHGGQASWIRVTDIPFVHGRDDFKLLTQTPSLDEIATVLRGVERRFELDFRREHALVRTNLANAEPAIRRWVMSL
jgi:hypothetical protein